MVDFQVDRKLARDFLDGMLIGYDEGGMGAPEYEPDDLFWDNEQQPGATRAIRDWLRRSGLVITSEDRTAELEKYVRGLIAVCEQMMRVADWDNASGAEQMAFGALRETARWADEGLASLTVSCSKRQAIVSAAIARQEALECYRKARAKDPSWETSDETAAAWDAYDKKDDALEDAVRAYTGAA